MLALNQLIELTFTFIFSLTTLFFLRKIAQRIGLVDKPNNRKLHNGAVPLVGGISTCISLLYFLFNNPNIIPNADIYAISVFILVAIGALDDKYDINFKIRIGIQAILSIAMMIVADIELKTIGNILGFGSINLSWFGYIVTIFAVIGAINAFNMVDGIDGLLGGLSTVTFVGLAFLLIYYKQSTFAYFCIELVIIIMPYILLNLGALGRKRKVFMGDAGSMLIGFTVIWLLLLSSQEQQSMIRPVTALWLIAVPLMDMVAIIIRRIKRGHSPFKPDREHLHHIFQRVGFSSTKTLIVICFIASLFAGIGISGEIYNIPEYIMFYGFISCFLIYLFILTHIWKITLLIRSYTL